MSQSETDRFDPIEETQSINRRFQVENTPGGMSFYGTAGFHSYFRHDAGIDYALHAALHAAIDKGLDELMLEPTMIEEEHGEVTPVTVAKELELQLNEFYNIPTGSWFSESLRDALKEVLEGWEESLS